MFQMCRGIVSQHFGPGNRERKASPALRALLLAIALGTAYLRLGDESNAGPATLGAANAAQIAATPAAGTGAASTTAASGTQNPSAAQGTAVASSPPIVSTIATKYVDTEEFALWNKYEEVAMHFNGLCMQLRTQALAAIASVLTISGLALSFAGKSTRPVQWKIFAGALSFLAIAWVALAVLDVCYYDRLLKGAVDALLEHESRTASLKDSAGNHLKDKNGDEVHQINLSTRIHAAASWRIPVVLVFYGAVLLALLAGVHFTRGLSKGESGTASAEGSEQKFDGKASVDVRLTMAPVLTAALPKVETSVPGAQAHS